MVLRCPAEGMTRDSCEVILDECQFIADTMSSVYENVGGKGESVRFTTKKHGKKTMKRHRDQGKKGYKRMNREAKHIKKSMKMNEIVEKRT